MAKASPATAVTAADSSRSKSQMRFQSLQHQQAFLGSQCLQCPYQLIAVSDLLCGLHDLVPHIQGPVMIGQLSGFPSLLSS